VRRGEDTVALPPLAVLWIPCLFRCAAKQNSSATFGKKSSCMRRENRVGAHCLPKNMKKLNLTGAILLFLCASLTEAFGQGTAFTYHGRLNNNGAPATGVFDMRFAVYDADAAGQVVAGPLPLDALGVTNGLFTARIDFGAECSPALLAGWRLGPSRRCWNFYHAESASELTLRLMPFGPKCRDGRDCDRCGEWQWSRVSITCGTTSACRWCQRDHHAQWQYRRLTPAAAASGR
jgi:hypothetical protein